VSDKLTGGL